MFDRCFFLIVVMNSLMPCFLYSYYCVFIGRLTKHQKFGEKTIIVLNYYCFFVNGFTNTDIEILHMCSLKL